MAIAEDGPLTGVRVLDLTAVFMGPSATQTLGDFGAEVTKVEPPEGDVVRNIGPNGHRGMGPAFLHLNRNKRSIVLDLKSAEGLAILLELVAVSDVLVYNIRPAAMDRLGLGYAALAALNPKLIYVGTFGYSQRGRYAAEPALDDAIQAAVALPHAAVMAGSDIPRYAPLALVDRTVGLYAVGVVCAALYARERSGLGQSIDVPMFETMAQIILADHMYGRTFSPPKGDFGYPRILNAHRRPYRTRDGHLCLVLYTDAHWRDFLRAVGRPLEFEADSRFASISTRTENIEALYRMVSDELEARTTEDWLTTLKPLGVPVVAMHTFETLNADPHLADIGFFRDIDHPTEGPIRTMACPSEWSATPPSYRRDVPRLGEHSREILAEMGYGPSAIDALMKSRISREPELAA